MITPYVFKVDFDKNSRWYPVRITITMDPIDGYTFYLNIYKKKAVELATILEDNSMNNSVVVCSTAQGNAYSVSWLNKSTIRMTSSFPDIIDLQEKFAEDLAYKIRMAIATKPPVVQPAKNVVHPIPDPLAGAKKRMHDNLKGVF
jgi:hypothetical protein